MKTRDDFLSALRDKLPEAYNAIDESEQGLLHLEVAAFRMTVEEACASGRAWYVEKAMRFVDRAEAGMVHVNMMTAHREPALAFGGVKDSGFGLPESGDSGIRFFTEHKSVYVQYSGG